MLLITVGITAYAAATNGAEGAISLNLMWGYFLAAFAVVASILCAVWGMINATEGLGKTVGAVVLVAVVVGVSYFIAAGNTVEIPNIETGGTFPHEDTVITEASVLVTYVTFAVAVVLALVSEIWGAIK
ncbi:MAG: hypothetical protein SNH01_00805 [Rikenellaceae bacterium]